MRKADFDWHIQDEQMPDAFAAAIQKNNLSPLLGKLLWQRGYRTEEEIREFLHPSVEQLHDPYLMHDMERAVERIQQAVIEGQRILVYGDYDADGITSTTIMKETLELLGADVEAFLPNRFEHGYGPNKTVYEEKIAEGIGLILTVDNGVAGHEAIEAANKLGVDVIITDHHELPSELPKAFAVVHPRHPQGEYPFGDLAGAGVAFKVSTALLEEVPAEFMDLAAIGTIADLVSLTGENRALVTMGIQSIRRSERIGLRALFKQSEQSIASADEGTIGFSIAPRLNAIGRLGDPLPAVTLLSTFDEEEAQQLAQSLDEINNERKTIVEKMTKEALAMVDDQNRIHLLAKEDWHEGVLGIVAGKVLEQTGKPSILLTLKEDGLAKGSGRSIAALNLYQMLDEMRELFTFFGGHHAAVGLTMPAINLAALQEQMNQYIERNHIDLTKGPELFIDETLRPEEVTLPFIEELKKLAPFGTENPLPNFLFKDIRAEGARQIGADQKHLKFAIQSNELLDAIAFGFGQEIEEITGGPVDLVGQLSINEWNGRKKPQVMVKDFAVNTTQFFDFRAKRFWQAPINDSNLLVLAFDKDSLRYVNKDLADQAVLWTETMGLSDIEATDKHSLVVIDVPEELDNLKKLVEAGNFDRIYLMGVSPEEAYLNGTGTREQYARLFKLVQSQDQIDVRYKLETVANYLKIQQKLLIFMIRVFFDLKFVTIENGVLRKVTDPQNHPLTDSKLYQQRQRKIKSEEFLILSDIPAIKEWLTI